MEIGVMVGGSGLAAVVEAVREVAAAGVGRAWVPQVFGVEALTAIAVAGREVPGIELGTSVIPTYPRHPMVLAQQALTTQAAIGGRLVLGIGLSHQVVIEGMFGYSFDKPARHMREYLSVLLPLLRGEQVAFEGDTIKAQGQMTVAEASPCPVLLAALAPRMLQLAGGVADGTITWMAAPKTLGPGRGAGGGRRGPRADCRRPPRRRPPGRGRGRGAAPARCSCRAGPERPRWRRRSRCGPPVRPSS